MDIFSSIATTNVTWEADVGDNVPKSAVTAATSGREFAVGAPGREPDHLN